MAADLEKVEKTVDQLAEEIVDILLEYADSHKEKKLGKKGRIDVQSKHIKELEKLKRRVDILENRLEKQVKNFKLEAVETGRLVSEKAEEAREENEQLLFDMQGQVDELRDHMKELVKAVKELNR